MPLAQPVCILGFALSLGVVLIITSPKWTRIIVAFYRKLKLAVKKGKYILDKGLK